MKLFHLKARRAGPICLLNACQIIYLFYVKLLTFKVDFVLQKDSKVIACELKFSPVVDASDGKHLRWFMDKVGADCRDAMIITTGGVAYRRKDGIAVIPAALLGA